MTNKSVNWNMRRMTGRTLKRDPKSSAFSLPFYFITPIEKGENLYYTQGGKGRLMPGAVDV